MDNKLTNGRLADDELISALADGQLAGADFANAVSAATSTPEGSATWQTYQVIGDVLRSAELAGRGNELSFAQRIQARISQEQIALPQAESLNATNLIAIKARQESANGLNDTKSAANDAVFRWKWLAGVASVAAVLAVAWNVAGLGGVGAGSGAQLAQQPLQPSQQIGEQMVAGVGQAASTGAGAGVGVSQPPTMLRDPRLDEFLAAHRQAGGTSALQSPSGFLRSATFQAPDR